MIGAHIGPFSTSGGIAQAGLDFNFSASLYQKIDTDGTNMVRTSTLSDLVTVSRASKKTNAGGWDFTSGGTVGALTEVDNNVAATDGTKGILVEESSTNEIRNPRCEGAVAGTPGTRPTNWSITAYGVSISIVGSGTEDGWPYVDIRFNGTPTSSPFVAFENNTQVSVANGETWTTSFGHRLVGGDTTNILGVKAAGFLYNSGPTYLSELYAAPTMPISSTHTRVSETATISEPTAASMFPAMTLLWDGSGDIDITLRIYAPQLEEKAYPTSPIFPPVGTPGASTRQFDYVTVADAAWRSDAAFSLYIKCLSRGNTSGAQVAVVNSAGSHRVSVIDSPTADWLRFFVSTGGVVQADRISTSDAKDGLTEYVSACRIADDNFGFSVKGKPQMTDNAGTAPSEDMFLVIGNDWRNNNAQAVNLYMQDFVYFPEALTDAQLEALVGN